jgi:hypothetical protein
MATLKHWNGTSWVTIGPTTNANLAAIGALTSAANTVPYFTGSGTADLTTLSPFGRTLIDDADAATARATLELVPGTDIEPLVAIGPSTPTGNERVWIDTDETTAAAQPLDQDLTDIAGITRTKGDLIVGSSSAWSDLAVGTDGHVLTADSAEATGVKWAEAAGGGTVGGADHLFLSQRFGVT